MDFASLTRRQLLLAAAALLAVVLLAGRMLAHRGAASPTTPPPLTAPRAPKAVGGSAVRLVVHVVGAIRRPGLYRLRAGSRVADAVTRAGGATRKADLATLNLAAPLADGTQVVVPPRVPGLATGAPATGSASAAGPVSQGPVRLNTATLEQLDELPGVGPVTAQKILDYRQEHGFFHSVDDLDAVSGIGPARLEQLRDLVTP